MDESAAPTLTEVTTLAGTAHANPLYPPDAPLIRVSVSGQPEPSHGGHRLPDHRVRQRLPRAAGRPG